jgi:hypothetical protein
VTSLCKYSRSWEFLAFVIFYNVGKRVDFSVFIVIKYNEITNTTIYEEFINEEARQQLFRPYRPSSGLKYKNAECLSVT